MSANNVVQGPWGTLPHSPDDKVVSEDVQTNFIFLMSQVMQNMDLLQIDIDSEEHCKDLCMIAESIRSYLYKVRGKYHPNQQIADELFYWEMGKLKMTSSINVEFEL
jgi:hypothetical protein